MENAVEAGQSGVAALQRSQEDWRPLYYSILYRMLTVSVLCKEKCSRALCVTAVPLTCGNDRGFIPPV